MNKKLLIVAGTVLATTGIYSAALTAASVATASATVDVLAPLTLTQTVGMDFGDVAGVTGTASTVVLDTSNGTGVTTNGAIAGGTPLSAAFDVTGDDTNSYTITLPASTTLSDGAKPLMTVNFFTDSKGGTSAAPSTTNNTTGGNDNFTVGATLNLGDGQPSGTYTGSYAISVDYN